MMALNTESVPPPKQPGGAVLTASGTHTTVMTMNGQLVINGHPCPDAEQVAMKLEGGYLSVCFKLKVVA